MTQQKKPQSQKPAYILRISDPPLWHKARIKAVTQKLTLREVIEKLLKEWVNA